MTPSVTLANLVDDAIFASVEHQFQLAAALGGDGRFDLSIPDGRITLGAGPRFTCGAQILGSAAPDPNTWLWGWANTVSELPTSVVAAACQAREVGQRYGISELVSAELPLVPRLTQALTVAAKAVTHTYFHYSCPTPGGTRIQVLLPQLALELPPAGVVQASQVIHQGLAEVGVTDGRRALRSFAAVRGLQVREADGVVQLVYPDGVATSYIDQWGRITHVDIH